MELTIKIKTYGNKKRERVIDALEHIVFRLKHGDEREDIVDKDLCGCSVLVWQDAKE